MDGGAIKGSFIDSRNLCAPTQDKTCREANRRARDSEIADQTRLCVIVVVQRSRKNLD
jgi:hypothetical protein